MHRIPLSLSQFSFNPDFALLLWFQKKDSRKLFFKIQLTSPYVKNFKHFFCRCFQPRIGRSYFDVFILNVNEICIVFFFGHADWCVTLKRLPKLKIMYGIVFFYRYNTYLLRPYLWEEKRIVPWREDPFEQVIVWYDGICPTKIKIWWQDIFLISCFLGLAACLPPFSSLQKWGGFFRLYAIMLSRVDGRTKRQLWTPSLLKCSCLCWPSWAALSCLALLWSYNHQLP